MSFEKFLELNNLPQIGEQVCTPSGHDVEVVRYVFDAYCPYVEVLAPWCNMEIEWTLDQIKVCKRKEN